MDRMKWKRPTALLAVLGTLGLIAAGAMALAPPDKQTSDKDKGKFVVHEWGTFLSVQGSDGTTLGGMVDSEENLPVFVRERALDGRNRACLTGKMETPVTYFYVDSPRTVAVRVGMKNGLLTHWYPAVDKFGPPHVKGVTASVGDSYLDWGQVDLVPDKRAKVGPNLPVHGWKPVSDTDTWRFARETDAAFVGRRYKERQYISIVTTKSGKTATGVVVSQNDAEIVLRDEFGKRTTIQRKDFESWDVLRNGRSAYVREEGEWEKFLFYRGVGALDLPLTVRSSGLGDDVRLMLHNRGSGTLRGLFALKVENGTIRYAAIPNLDGEGRHELALNALRTAKRCQSAKDDVAAALVEAGLYPKEAAAMVNTWDKSYFQTDGIRILYILPRSNVDEIIPIEIKPAPDKLERVMVGRVEVLTPEMETHIIKAVSTMSMPHGAVQSAARAVLARLGRLREPALHRVTALAPDADVKAKAEALLNARGGQ